jgi:hypothetical protein
LNWQKFTSVLQLVAAGLGIPAAAGGTYSVYRSYIAPPANCQTLKAALLETLDRTIAPASKRALMKTDLAEFTEKCGARDPDSLAVFAVAASQLDHDRVLGADPAASLQRVATAAAASDSSGAASADPAHAAPGLFDKIEIGGFGKAGPEAAQGWVALDRRDPDHFLQSSFDGFEAGKAPAEKALLTALWPVPVWSEPQKPGLPDVHKVVGRLATGQCLRLLSYRTAGQGRPWANVETAQCQSKATK